MKLFGLMILALGTAWLAPQAITPQDSKKSEAPQSKPTKTIPEREFLKSLEGEWEGTCRTWFFPGKLADESKIKGTIRPILGGRFMRHDYDGAMKGKARHGEETIAFNSMDKRFQISWFDDFHMNYALLFSEGDAIERGFSVSAKYDTGRDTPQWTWRTTYELIDKDHLTITAYNTKPGSEEAKAVETVYARVK